MDQWNEFKRYELEQRRMKLTETQRIADEQERKKKEAEYRLSLRKRERMILEQRQAEERSIAEQQSSEKQKNAEEYRLALLAQSAKELRRANQQREESQRLASQRLQAIQQVREKGSPIERIFFEAWCEAYPTITLERQHQIGKYFVDFAHVETKIAIELDGHAFHSSRKDRTRDYQRQRFIEDQGWSFVRFTGSEVFHGVASCVQITWERIQQGR